MKPHFIIIALLAIITANAQVGIGTTTPDASAILEVKSTSKGVILPKVSLLGVSDITTIPNPTQGLLVYNLASVGGLNIGYTYWDGTQWATFLDIFSPTTGWGLSGNALSGGEFLGSTNSQALNFRVNNTAAGSIKTNTSMNLGLSSSSNGLRSTAIGTESSAGGDDTFAGGRQASASGGRATAVGFESSAAGDESTAFGRGATASSARSTAIGFETTATSEDATAVGRNADASAARTTAVGYNSLASGIDAAAFGSQARAQQVNAIAIGTNSTANASNSVVIGANTSTTQANAFIVGSGLNVGVGTTTPDASSIRHLNANNKGILIPKVSLSATNNASPVTSPATGLLVFNTVSAGTFPNNVTVGFYYWDGTRWRSITDTPVNRTTKFSNNTTNLDISSDSGSGTGVTVDIFGSQQWNEDTSIFNRLNSTDLQILEPGYYEVTTNLYLHTDDIERYLKFRLRLNSTDVGDVIAAIGPEDSGSDRTFSANFTQVIFINRNDILRLRSYRDGSNATINFASLGTSSISVKKLR